MYKKLLYTVFLASTFSTAFSGGDIQQDDVLDLPNLGDVPIEESVVVDEAPMTNQAPVAIESKPIVPPTVTIETAKETDVIVEPMTPEIPPVKTETSTNTDTDMSTKKVMSGHRGVYDKFNNPVRDTKEVPLTNPHWLSRNSSQK